MRSAVPASPDCRDCRRQAAAQKSHVAAQALQAKAARIAESLQLALFFRLDRQPLPRPADATGCPMRSANG